MEEQFEASQRLGYSLETLGAVNRAEANLSKLSTQLSALLTSQGDGGMGQEVEDLKMAPPSNLCSACLEDLPRDACLPDATILTTFDGLIGGLRYDLQIKFCPNCQQCLENLARFKQTCIESVEFLEKIHNEEVPVKVEDLLEQTVHEIDVIKTEDDDQFPDTHFSDSYEDEVVAKVKTKKRVTKQRKKRAKNGKGAAKKDERMRYCGICKQHFANILMPHIFDVHIISLGNNQYHCLICDSILTQRSTLKFHFDTHNTLAEPLTCDQCSEVFVQKLAYVKHMQKHQRYECDHCNRTLSTKSRLREHILTQHTDAKKCSYCSEVFYDDAEYAAHQKVERERRNNSRETNRRVCDICGFNASCGPALSAHKERRHPSSEVVCDFCGKTCINRHQYRWHLREYHEEKRFTCSICQKKFSQKAGLNKHIKVMHDRSSTVACDICGNVFTLMYSLKKHKETVHSNICKFVCKICGRGFKVAALLKKHQFSHLNKKPFNCHLCTTGYYMVDYLKSHYLRIHDLNFSAQEVKECCVRVSIDKDLL